MKSEMNKLDENIQKVSSVWSREASVLSLKTISGRQANLTLLDLTIDRAALGRNFNSYTQADNKAMDLVHKYLGK